jgi:hypothetical protein
MKISDLPEKTFESGVFLDIDQDIYGVVDKVPKISAVGITTTGQQVVQTNNSGIWSSVPSAASINTGMGSVNTVVATTSGVVPSVHIPLKITRPRYNMFEKPVFNDGEVVEVDLTFYGMMKDRDEKTGDWLQNIVETVCLGYVDVDNNFRLYMLDFGDYLFKPNYPFRVMGVPSQAIIKQEFLSWDQK